MKQKPIKAPWIQTQGERDIGTNHYVAEKEVNLQHLSVDSETKH